MHIIYTYIQWSSGGGGGGVQVPEVRTLGQMLWKQCVPFQQQCSHVVTKSGRLWFMCFHSVTTYTSCFSLLYLHVSKHLLREEENGGGWIALYMHLTFTCMPYSRYFV